MNVSFIVLDSYVKCLKNELFFLCIHHTHKKNTP